MPKKPKASSTPKIVPVTCRRPIGDMDDSLDSPIGNYKLSFRIPEGTRQPKDLLENKTKSDSEEESDDYVDSSNEINEEMKNTRFCNCINPAYVLILSIVIFLMGVLHGYSGENQIQEVNIEMLSQEFPSQVEDFWIYINQGIEDIKRFSRPRSFVLLYNDESQETLQKLLNRVTKFATCTLTNCSALPVVLEAHDLRKPSVLKDYGEIISGNKKPLEDSGVIIINNLEKVPGVSAQAFHSLCDEYNPVVEKAVIIFTMKVDKFHNNNLKFIENYLHKHWNDLKDDIFYPLFTRIANVVLPIMVER